MKTQAQQEAGKRELVHLYLALTLAWNRKQPFVDDCGRDALCIVHDGIQVGLAGDYYDLVSLFTDYSTEPALEKRVFCEGWLTTPYYILPKLQDIMASIGAELTRRSK